MSTITQCFTHQSKFNFQEMLNFLVNLSKKVIYPKQKQKVLKIHLNQPKWTIGHEMVALARAFSHVETIEEEEIRFFTEKCEQLPLPVVGERVLCLWRNWNQKAKSPAPLVSPYLFASIETVEACRIQEVKNQIRVRNIWFEGGGIASKTYTPDLFMGYIARLDCVEELLKMLQWLTPKQRQIIYELAYSGQKFPE